MIEPILIVDELERLAEIELLQLDFNKLIEVVQYADGERALCTRNDPKGFDFITVNAKAARGLREQFCGEDWVYDETDNQPGIFNPKLKIRVIPCNFDENAGNPLLIATNRKDKGTASGKKARCNGTAWLPGLETPFESIKSEDITTLVLGIYSEEGEPLRAELSFPIEFKGNKYTSFSKRIVLLDGDEGISLNTHINNRSKPTETVDIDIVRRK